jgi:hypothetical protein
MIQLLSSLRSIERYFVQHTSIFLLAGVVTFLSVSTSTAQSATFELSNKIINVAIDAQGNMVKLVNVATGHNYLASPGHELWKMYYRTSDARELEIPFSKQKANVSKESNALLIVYPSLIGNVPLRGSSRTLNVTFTLRVELDGDQLLWTAAIRNDEKEPDLEISELWLPWIGGIGNLGKGGEEDKLYWPEDGGRCIVDPYSKLSRTSSATGTSREIPRNNVSFYQITYPWPASMQWYTLSNGTEGIYVASHDKSLMTTTLNVMADRTGLSFSMVKYPFVKTGETWTSAPTIIRLYTGDWHEAANGYRLWADTWMPKPNPPKWMQRINGWIIPNLKTQNGSRYNGVYADLPKYWRDAHAVGLDMISIYGWEKQGFDNWYPEFDADPGMGGEEGLKAAIAEIKAAGGKVNLYSQGQLIDPGTAYYRRIGYRQTAKDIWGGEYRETYGGRGSGTLLNIQLNKMFGVACPLAPGWYDQLVSQFDMALKYGVTGLMYDQIAGRPPYICYDKEHMHTKPSLAFGPGKLQNLLKLRERIKAHDPDFAFLHELNVDVFTGIGDITQPVNYGFVPMPESFGELFKYTFPDRIITNRTNSNRKACFGYGFALQWRVDGMMSDTTDPMIAPYLKRLNQLRTEFADLLLEGRFVDNEGFTSENTNVSAYAYLAGNRMAITIWNSTSEPQKPQIVAKEYTLESVNWQDTEWKGTDHQILPGDVALFVFRKK